MCTDTEINIYRHALLLMSWMKDIKLLYIHQTTLHQVAAVKNPCSMNNKYMYTLIRHRVLNTQMPIRLISLFQNKVGCRHRLVIGNVLLLTAHLNIQMLPNSLIFFSSWFCQFKYFCTALCAVESVYYYMSVSFFFTAAVFMFRV